MSGAPVSGPGRRRDRPTALWVALGAAVLVGALVIGAPEGEGAALDPTSSGPLGALGLVRFLEELDAEVALAQDAPGREIDVALVLADRLGSARRDDVLAWVRGGGTLVVADPGSALVPVPVIGELSDPRAGEAGCGIDALAGVGALDVDGLGFDLGVRDRGCLGDGTSFFVAASPLGDGTIVSVGGAGAWVNERLGDRDNAVLAGALLAPAPGTVVAVLLAPLVGDGTASLTDLVGDGVKQALLQLGLAFLLYALWRGRRLGGPVPEEQPVTLAASELVVAVGNLLQQGRHHERAAAMIRNDLRRHLAARLGLPVDASPDAVAEAAGDRTGLDHAHLLRLLAPAPTRGDGDLAALASDAHAVTEELARAR